METSFNNYAQTLIIEDNHEQAAEMLKMFEELLITDSILWLEDGIQAMNYLHGLGVFLRRDVKINPKLIFLDMDLPGKNGLEVLSEIRSNPRLRQIPVVFMCSTDKELDRVKNHNHCIDDYILKPIDSFRLTNVINIILSNHQIA
jgi:CheY-like chemotaxis protein